MYRYDVERIMKKSYDKMDHIKTLISIADGETRAEKDERRVRFTES